MMTGLMIQDHVFVIIELIFAPKMIVLLPGVRFAAGSVGMHLLPFDGAVQLVLIHNLPLFSAIRHVLLMRFGTDQVTAPLTHVRVQTFRFDVGLNHVHQIFDTAMLLVGDDFIEQSFSGISSRFFQI